jgi:hypothetical protein
LQGYHTRAGAGVFDLDQIAVVSVLLYEAAVAGYQMPEITAADLQKDQLLL